MARKFKVGDVVMLQSPDGRNVGAYRNGTIGVVVWVPPILPGFLYHYGVQDGIDEFAICPMSGSELHYIGRL